MEPVDPVVAAHLLQRWAPENPETGGPAHWLTPVRRQASTAPDAWTSALTPAEAARYGGFPETFALEGTAGHRHPVAVQLLSDEPDEGGELDDEGDEFDEDDDSEEGDGPSRLAEDLERLLTEALSSGHARPDDRARVLISALAQGLDARMEEVVQVAVAAEPDGAPLEGELHLLGREYNGCTFRLSVAPAPALASSPAPALAPSSSSSPSAGASADGLWPDPERLRAGEIAPPGTLTEEEYRRADLTVRARCGGALLGEFVWLNNNDRMTVDVQVVPHGLSLGLADRAGADVAFRSWWEKSDTWAQLEAEEWWEGNEEAAVPRLLDEEPLAAVLARFEEQNLGAARSGAWALGDIEDYDVEDDPQPGFPEDQLVVFLGRDVFETVTRCVAGGPGDPPPLVYAIGFPAELSAEDEEYASCDCLLAVGPERVSVTAFESAI